MRKNSRRTGPKAMERLLIYFPIIHTNAEMGKLSEPMRQATLQIFGLKGLKSKANFVDKLWTKIEQTVEGLGLSFENVRLYQDGLPVCGHEARIIADLAASGSRNYRLLLRLMGKGATAMGTESPVLLVEEYELAKNFLAPEGAVISVKRREQLMSLSDSLLLRRDRYIADRINDTLCPGETGILFLGMLHSLGHILDERIKVISPVTGNFE